jgi:hypothetical protein
MVAGRPQGLRPSGHPNRYLVIAGLRGVASWHVGAWIRGGEVWLLKMETKLTTAAGGSDT